MNTNEKKIEYPKVVAGKSPERVLPGYLPFPTDWIGQYNMLLPDGITCKSCHHCSKCVSMWGQKETYDFCQFTPNRFSPITTQQKEAGHE